MKKLNILLLVALLSIFKAFSSEKIVVNGIEREYLKFTPENLMAESPYSILVLLHYNGAKASDFADLCRASTLASLYNTVVLVPQALDEQDSDVLSLLTLAESLGEYPGMSKTAVWGAGVSVAPSELIPSDYMPIFTMLYPQMAATGKVEFNKSIDDIAFINAIIEDTRENNFANSAQVFLAGSSMGGAMTYKYAYSQESQADAIAVIAGFVGAEVDNSSPLNIPVCVFHSEDDEVVLYQGSTLNKSVPDFIDKIVSENGCGQNLTSQFPDLASDGIEVNLTKYDCDVNKRVWFYNIKGARHSDYLISDYVTGPNDIDYPIETWKFFLNIDNNSIDEFEMTESKNIFYPNPALDLVYFTESCDYELLDFTGKVIKKGFVNKDEYITFSHVQPGIYLIRYGKGILTSSESLIIK